MASTKYRLCPLWCAIVVSCRRSYLFLYGANNRNFGHLKQTFLGKYYLTTVDKKFGANMISKCKFELCWRTLCTRTKADCYANKLFVHVRGISAPQRFHASLQMSLRDTWQSRKISTKVDQKSSTLDPQSAGSPDVSFDNFRLAFSKKSNWEIIRALLVLWLCSFDFIVNRSLALMKASERLVGRRLTNWLLKKTFYGQFVAGENKVEITQAVARLRETNVGPLLAAPMEDDIHTYHADAQRKFDDNLTIILSSMMLACDLDPMYPMIQLKLTALMPGDLCALVSEECPYPSARPDVVEAMVAALGGRSKDIFRILGGKFPDSMRDHLEHAIKRVTRVYEVAINKDVIVMVDAEYSYLNPALNLFALALMTLCNDPTKRRPLVFYTYQNYLKSTWNILQQDLLYLESRNVGFAAKMVRGAYMFKERQRAAKLGQPDPVQDSYEDTSLAYDKAVATLLEKVAAQPKNYRIIVATHNELSALRAIKRMQALNIEAGGGSVFFAQLLGMADHVSCSLGVSGFLARKSLPYGPVQENMPYLSRRAQENKAVLAGARRERYLLRAELRDRISSKKT